MKTCLLGVMMACAPVAAWGQSVPPVDRTDPAVVEEELGTLPPRDAVEPELSTVDRRPAAGATEMAPILAGAIRIEGAHDFSQAAFAGVVERYVGRPLDTEALRSLALDVANVARGAGYGLATAWVPQQRLAHGMLRVELDQGRIDAVAVDGDRVAERYLARLVTGRPVTTADLERQLLLAGDVAGVSLGKPRLRREGGRNVLHVKARRDSSSLRASVDNWGSETVGPVRVRLAYDLNGVIADNDRLTLGGVVTPLQPREFALASLGYEKGIGTSGTELRFDSYYARSRPGAYLRDRDLGGESMEAEFGVRHPFVRSRAASLWGSAVVGIRQSEQEIAGRPVRDDRIVSATAGAYAVARTGGARIRGRLNLTQGLDALGATDRGDPLASRRDAGPGFTKLEFWAEYTRPLGAGFSLQLQGEGQVASGPLLSSEEMGLGGRYFLRAYDYREYSGDKGIAGSVEIRFDLKDMPQPFDRAQVYAYGDAGSVGNYGTGRGGGSLTSAGGGVRFELSRKILAGVGIGVPLSRSDFDRNPDPRLSFTISGRF